MFVIQFFDAEYFVMFAGRTGTIVVTSDVIKSACVFETEDEAKSLILQMAWKDADVVKK